MPLLPLILTRSARRALPEKGQSREGLKKIVLWAKEYEDITGLVDFSITSYGFLIFQTNHDIGYDLVAIDLNGEVI